MNAYAEMLNCIEWVLRTKSSYQVAKDLGINNRTANRYQNGETPIENMTLKTAKTFYSHYKEEFEMEKITFEGKTYTLTQQAYITEANGVPYYEAAAIDEEGNEVTVSWDIRDVWLGEDGKLNGLLKDESDACDWDNPASVE